MVNETLKELLKSDKHILVIGMNFTSNDGLEIRGIIKENKITKIGRINQCLISYP